MTKEQKIERINSYLPHLKDEVLDAFLGLLKNTRTELEDDEWDLQIKEDADAGRLDELMETALEDYKAGDATDLFEGLKARKQVKP